MRPCGHAAHVDGVDSRAAHPAHNRLDRPLANPHDHKADDGDCVEGKITATLSHSPAPLEWVAGRDHGEPWPLCRRMTGRIQENTHMNRRAVSQLILSHDRRP